MSDEAISQVHHLQGCGGLNAELTDALRTSWAHRRRKDSYPAPPLKHPQEAEGHRLNLQAARGSCGPCDHRLLEERSGPQFG